VFIRLTFLFLGFLIYTLMKLLIVRIPGLRTCWPRGQSTTCRVAADQRVTMPAPSGVLAVKKPITNNTCKLQLNVLNLLDVIKLPVVNP